MGPPWKMILRGPPPFLSLVSLVPLYVFNCDIDLLDNYITRGRINCNTLSKYITYWLFQQIQIKGFIEILFNLPVIETEISMIKITSFHETKEVNNSSGILLLWKHKFLRLEKCFKERDIFPSDWLFVLSSDVFG